MRKDKICLRDLVPTQSQVGKAQVDAIKTLLVPVVCVRYKGKYYVLDGHARSLRALQMGLESVDAMVLFPETPIDYGVAKTAKEMNLKSLKDIKTVD
jgi:IMP dehydrogenase